MRHSSLRTIHPVQNRRNQEVEIYTQTKVKLATPHFFGDTVLEVAEQNMWVMEIKYFEFSCKFYYFYEHLEL